MINTSEYIVNLLQSYRDNNGGNLYTVDNAFIYALGPYMVNTPDFYDECMEISRTNMVMKVMMVIHSSEVFLSKDRPLNEKRKLLSELVEYISTNFNSIENEEQKGFKIALENNVSSIIKKHIKNYANESMVTAMAPSVPYNTPTLEKQWTDIESTFSIVPKSFEYSNEVYTLFINNVTSILTNYHISEVLLNDISNSNISNETDKIILSSDISSDVKKYYLVAFCNFFKSSADILNKYYNVLSLVMDDDKIALESIISSINEIVSVPTNIDEITKPNDLLDIENLLIGVDKKTSLLQGENAKYNFTDLDNYIFINRYMQFDEYANRLFTSRVDHNSILNINDRGQERIYYEMTNNTIMCPYTDLSDWQVKILVLHANSNKIQVLTSFDDL